ncbi:MAG: DUF881 domain-containing protein [Clostridium sp.]|uniref:DUF881 domain-containing protein n=1 Tax=Clostridium sp. DSM 8431 TaxID=1761781 RepID=UPI0008EA08DB|nr:DUF881 domain-containing protein [Clostridium sp. DSM 8431]MCR4943377.1 DUF881 domain-containing protein [Clostridium sp.]SFU28455.1 Uncharacterized conserved protein YlxW, UPF0749 family [Clostridium sp. DSM 8431]
MKKVVSQVTVALVCAILGFLLAYQFKVLAKNDSQNGDYSNSNILDEIESLKKEKEELASTNAKLTEEVKKIEESASEEGEIEKEIKKQLDTARMQLGLVDVEGPGIIITITPKTNIFGSGSTSDISTNLDERELINIINLLWFSKAEAISVNDYRITPQTGIKTSNNYLWIGSAGKVSPKEKIVIEAIGDKTKLNVGVRFQSDYNLTTGTLANYDVDVKLVDELQIDKTTQTLKSDYITPVVE